MRWGLEPWKPLAPEDADALAEAEAAFDEITFVLGVALHLSSAAKAARRAAP